MTKAVPRTTDAALGIPPLLRIRDVLVVLPSGIPGINAVPTSVMWCMIVVVPTIPIKLLAVESVLLFLKNDPLTTARHRRTALYLSTYL